MSALDPTSLSRQLIEDSYAVLPGLYDAAKVSRVRSRLEALVAEIDPPQMYSKEPQWLGDNIEISATGLVLHKLLGFAPELHRDLLDPVAVDIARRALGPDMYLEFVGAIAVDHTRPFFAWHNHVGGIDDEKYRRLGAHDPIEAIERVAMIVYLDTMAPGTGQFMLHPHRVNGAMPPPAPRDEPNWEGRLVVEGPPGTVVMIDQTTWHAALPRTVEGELRYFMGVWFASGSAPASDRVDETLARIEQPDPLLRAVLETRPQHGSEEQ